jgi:hypothetical protein
MLHTSVHLIWIALIIFDEGYILNTLRPKAFYPVYMPKGGAENTRNAYRQSFITPINS